MAKGVWTPLTLGRCSKPSRQYRSSNLFTVSVSNVSTAQHKWPISWMLSRLNGVQIPAAASQNILERLPKTRTDGRLIPVVLDLDAASVVRTRRDGGGVRKLTSKHGRGRKWRSADPDVGGGAALRRHRGDGLTCHSPLHLVCVLVYLLETTTTTTAATSLCNYSLVLLHSL